MNRMTSGFDPIDDLVEAFLEQYRQGRRPSLTEYADRHPELADRVRALFPALIAIEEAGLGERPSPVAPDDRTGSGEMLPRRLGDYVLLRRIGSGGMGIVYEAIQESLGRHVALKTLPPHHLDVTRLERFRREARAAARLHHTHIVPVYGIGEHDGLHYYTMQFIRGHGLDAVLREVFRMRRDPNLSEALETPDDPASTTMLASGLRAGCFPSGEAGPEGTKSSPAASGPTKDDAAAAFDEVVRARPYNVSGWIGRAELHFNRRHLAKAAADLAAAIRARPDNLRLRYARALLLLAQGDQAEFRRACAETMGQYGAATNPQTANAVAWKCVLDPDAVADPDEPVRLADVALAGIPADQKPDVMNTLGAALYRAGRFEESIRRLKEGIRMREDAGRPQDWAFLALAHHRLGRREEALRWLGRLRSDRPKENVGNFWSDLEIRLLRSEAEAVVLHDPAFPSDPFTR